MVFLHKIKPILFFFSPINDSDSKDGTLMWEEEELFAVEETLSNKVWGCSNFKNG